MAIIAKRTVMSLFTDDQDIYNHQVRVVLAEKGINVDVHPVNLDEVSEDLLEINPYGTVPTLVDHELVVYDAKIIMEYLDERFPHPPLMPVYPVVRAETRKMMYRIDRDWYSLMDIIHAGTPKEVEEARRMLRDSLTNLAPVTEFSLLDCCLAPLLWRLTQLGIELPPSAKPVMDYAERMFARESFQTSLTDTERELCAA